MRIQSSVPLIVDSMQPVPIVGIHNIRKFPRDHSPSNARPIPPFVYRIRDYAVIDSEVLLAGVQRVLGTSPHLLA